MLRKILIVEDEEEIIELLLSIFDDFKDYKILCSRNSTQALHIIETDTPDIIILDIQIPIITGIDLCRLIKSKKALSDIKILVLTGMSQHYDIQKAIKAGADACMTKPFNIDAIIKKVKELLNDELEKQ